MSVDYDEVFDLRNREASRFLTFLYPKKKKEERIDITCARGKLDLACVV